MKQSRLNLLLECVARRRRLACITTRLWRCWLILAAAYLLLLLLSRILGLIPPWFTVGTLAVVPLAALMLALLLHRRPSPMEAARIVDARTAGKDLFLTASVIHNTLGAYQDLVLAEAERRAAGIKPSQVLRPEWRRGAASAGGSLAALCLAVLFLPQLDPFGRQQEHRRLTEQRTRLHETWKATALRAALLAQQTDVRPAQIAQAVTELQKAFNTAKPENKTGTFTRLNEQQKVLGELWRRASEEKLREALNRAPAAQSFGLNDPAKAQQWRNDLQKGNTDSVNRELNEMKALARQLGQTSDPVRREELRQELMNRLQSLQEALAQQMNSQPLDAALQRALEQLQMCSQKSLSAEALKGLTDSLNLTAEELKQLAKALGELQSLEEALKALQSAKRLHGVKPLDGQICKNCNKLGDYAALFDALYAAACPGSAPLQGAPGVGMGPGQGVGPRPYGDDSAASAFTPQQSASAFQPGKVLLSWRTREVSDPGQAREEYRQAVDAVRQDASEAILQEQIPASYHTAIKSYFDTLRDDPAPPVKP